MKIKEIFIGAAVGAIGSILTGLFFFGGQWEQWKNIRDSYPGIKEKTETHVKHHPTPQSTPKNLVGFFDQQTCTAGWEEVSNLNGRYVVGVTGVGARIGETVGIPLTSLENRPFGRHAHTINASGKHTHGMSKAGNHAHAFNGAIHYNSGAGSHARAKPTGAQSKTSTAGNHLHSISETSDHKHTMNEAGKVDGTNAPYVQLLACRKQ